MKYFASLSLASILGGSSAVKATMRNIIQPGASITADSPLGAKILSKSRQLDNGNIDYSFVGGYSLKFQGCHHINQWNEYAEDEEDVRIMTKRLVRFRLCPTDTCQSYKTAGCTSHYGDYVVDMNTFVASYLENDAMIKEANCENYAEVCEANCGGNDDDCMNNCYGENSMSYCIEAVADDDAAVAQLDPVDYSACAQYEFQNQVDDGDDAIEAYYLGPYCGDQGGEVNFGLFTDDTCTTFASGGKNLFYQIEGYELPYGSENVVDESCISCMVSGDDDDAGEWNDYMGEDNINQICATAYQVAGKCETKMDTDYPNESACSYIEGIKIIRDDGVIRTSSIKKSRAAAVSIGLFTTVAVLLGAYVYYLRTKLSRARISLSAQG